MIERIGRYRITRKLGEGGMGVVYAALDERLERAVAVKMLRPSLADDRSRERLWQEARAAASVSHPNICQVFEIGEEGEDLFIAMELLEGETLADRIGRGTIPPLEAAPTTLAILGALEQLHSSGLVHRDLKPSNIFLTPHGVKVLDFGIAREVAPDAARTVIDVTMPGVVIGTPQYFAPEQLRGDVVDGRTDLFAVGALLFEMLSGKPPFSGPSVFELARAIATDPPPVLGGSAIVVAMDRIIHRALQKRPEQRYTDAAAMANDVRAAMALADSGEAVRAVRMTRLIVLPFRTLRSDPETDFLAFSLPDGITSSLSRLQSLVVRSSVTAAQFASDRPDLDLIAAKADVDVVLAGTLLRAGDQIRVTTQLMEAPGGAVLWSQTSQVQLGNIFQLQDDLVQHIVESLSLPLSAGDRTALQHDRPATAKAYEFYLRANELGNRSIEWTLARDMYLQCLAEDPQFAPAWARLGRIHRVLGMYSDDPEHTYFEKAQEAFRRALEISPDLPLAHNLYTSLEVELGGAQDAMLRLLERAQGRAADPELFAGLVQACRYCGLLEASVGAYEHARRLEPGIRTSVAHAYLMLGQHQAAIDTDVEDPPILTGWALDLLGRPDEGVAWLKNIEQTRMSKVKRLWVTASRALLERQQDEAHRAVDELFACWISRDPCGRYYLARQLAVVGETDRALDAFREAVEGGFCCYAFYTRDPWLDSLRSLPEFRTTLHRAEERSRTATAAFLQAGGDRVIGLRAPVTLGV